MIAYDRLIRGYGSMSTIMPPSTISRSGCSRASRCSTGSTSRTTRGRSTLRSSAARPDDNNAYFFYDGAMSVLQPHIDDGTLVIPVRPDRHGHGRHAALGRLRGARPAWTTSCRPITATPCRRGAVPPFMMACPSASSTSLRGVGYWQRRPADADHPPARMPKSPRSRRSLAATSTRPSFKDTRELARVTVGHGAGAARRRRAGDQRHGEPMTTGVKVVPSYLLEPVLVTAENWKRSRRPRVITPASRSSTDTGTDVRDTAARPRRRVSRTAQAENRNCVRNEPSFSK